MKLTLTAIFSLLSLVLFSQKDLKNLNNITDSIQKLDEVIIQSNVLFGNKLVAKNRTGSAHYIAPAEIKKLGYLDINRLLRTVPGVNIVEEDGLGLRPNISLRGTSPERSAKISLMEDGVLIAPAPYSASAAYYFPTIARMQAVEILKGSSQVQYGPFTTGGAINLVSTQLPEEFSGRLKTTYGNFDSAQIYASIGDSKELFGYNVEYLNFSSNGFKNLLNDRNTGFDKNDLVAKFRINTNKNSKIQQALNVKFQYSDEVSNETYLGLSELDFQNSPLDRYSASQQDKMINDHIQILITHQLDISNNLRVTSNGYYNGFSRNWYKLNDVTADGEKVGISKILETPDSYPFHFGYINGNLNSNSGALAVKANNRSYISKGIQTKLDYHFYTNNLFHDIEIGLRYHYDEEDRFQWVDNYDIENGIMSLTNAGIPGTESNRVSSAKAFAGSILYKITYQNLTLTPGIRYENMSLKRDNYGTNDVTRTGTNLFTRENKIDIFIPGIGFNYKFSNGLALFGGLHKGFSPPGNEPGQKAEESINYELGTRFSHNGLSGEFTGFYNDYSNLLGSDLAATGGTGSLDLFNAGEVSVKGLEILINYDLMNNNEKLSAPVTISYTFTDTEFLNSFDSADGIWGIVTKGDEIPYIAKHQFNASISLESKKYNIILNSRYNGAFRTTSGSGKIPNNEKVPSSIILDLSCNYKLTDYLRLNTNIINLLDNTYIVSRVPAGLRPGHPFGIYGGLEYTF